jgi:glycosyltransferase involved in cell wall biosynthesis
MEVVIILDGCTDGSSEMVHNFDAPYPIRVFEQEKRGLTISRNRGADEARGRILVYLDDDIEAAPTLVEGYIEAHADQKEKMVVGFSPPVIPDPPGWLGIIHRLWWHDAFHNLGKPGWRFVYQDTMGCNFSVTKSLYQRLGGQNDKISSFSREDWEFGLRLLKSGAPIEYAPQAWGHHHVSYSVDRDFSRNFQEGRAEARMAQIYPDIWKTLNISKPGFNNFLMSSLVRRLAFHAPKTTHGLISFFLKKIVVFTRRFYLHGRLFSILNGIDTFWYWAGVAEELKTHEKLEELWRMINDYKEDIVSIKLDLSEGFEVVESQLDEQRPDAAEVFFGDYYVGLIPKKPGAESLRGVHLRPYIAEHLSVQLVRALAFAGYKSGNQNIDHLIQQVLSWEEH